MSYMDDTPAAFTDLTIDMNDYELLAMRTASSNPKAATLEARLLNFSLGLAGEAGEVADLIKKHIYHGHPLDKEKLVKELGDCLWYVTGMAWALNVGLARVATVNITKLRKRFPNGFSTEASINRVDTQPIEHNIVLDAAAAERIK